LENAKQLALPIRNFLLKKNRLKNRFNFAISNGDFP